MGCLGVEPGAAGWKVQTNPLSYGGTPNYLLSLSWIKKLQTVKKVSLFDLKGHVKNTNVYFKFMTDNDLNEQK